MPVTVLRVVSAEKHPNADSLRVYELVSVDNFRTKIVANLTNIYEAGDHAIVAQLGSKLKDGTYIQEVTLRGIVSSGMMIGKTDLPLGTDLTDEYCLPIYHISWPDITLLSGVYKHLQDTDTKQTVQYVSKIKLDGTNAGIQIHTNGGIVAQSRELIITPEQDNDGFARWVYANKGFFSSKAPKNKDPIVVFGEWMTIPNSNKKALFVFAIQHGGYTLDINPKSISALLGEHEDIHIVPFHESLTLHYNNETELKEEIDTINQWVASVEKCDPYLKATFNIEKTGEGFVFYPIPGHLLSNINLEESTPILIDRGFYKDFVFKAKGEKHRVIKTKQAVQIDPEVAKNAEIFADLFVTENRLNQFAAKFDEFDIKKTGEFLKLFLADVVKESSVELQASNLAWKDVSNVVSNRTRQWWIEKSNTIKF